MNILVMIAGVACVLSGAIGLIDKRQRIAWPVYLMAIPIGIIIAYIGVGIP